MTENKNRCVITGLGMISAVGENTADCWKSAVEGKSGIRHTKSVDTENCYADYAAEVPDEYLADLADHKELDRAARLGVKAGSCVGGVVSIEHYYTKGKDSDDVVKMPISAIASQVARLSGAGGVVTNIANACAAGTMSIAYASDLIRDGRADIVIAGGADAFASVPYAGFLPARAGRGAVLSLQPFERYHARRRRGRADRRILRTRRRTRCTYLLRGSRLGNQQ